MAGENYSESCIILTRVSTNSQDYSAQVKDLHDWATKLGYKYIEEISTKESGFRTFDAKEGFQRVIHFISEHTEYKSILITELSRLSRRKIVLEEIKVWLIKNKIQLLVKDINFRLFDESNTVNIITDMTFSMFASIAESEMQTKKIRFKRELKNLHMNGISITGKELFGYKRVYNESLKKNVFIINDKEAEEIRTIYKWYLNGIDNDITKCSIIDITLACIAKNFSKYLHSKRNVTKCLSEKAYTGYKITHNKRKNTEYWNYKILSEPKYISCSSELKYPIILSEEIYNKVQEKKLSRNTLADKSTKHITLLSKLIKCNKCGRYLTGNYRFVNGYIGHNYRCTRRNTVVNCDFKGTYSMPLLDSAVWSFLKNDISDLVANMQEYYFNIDVGKIEDEIKNIDEKIAYLEEQKNIEATIFRTLSRTNKELAETQFIQRIRVIDNNIEKLIFAKKEKINMIDNINESKLKNYEEELKNEIEEIENKKELLRKYILLLVREIKVLYNDMKYMVISITTIENMGESFDYEKGDFIENKKNINYFLIIDKHDNNRIKLRYIYNPKVKFENSHFELNGIPTYIGDIFLTPCASTLNEPYISLNKDVKRKLEDTIIHFSMEEINYQRLAIY